MQDEARFTTEYLGSKYEERKGELTLVNSNKTVYPITLSKEDKERALPLYGTCITAPLSRWLTSMQLSAGYCFAVHSQTTDATNALRASPWCQCCRFLI